jgi:hypothetical protein
MKQFRATLGEHASSTAARSLAASAHLRVAGGVRLLGHPLLLALLVGLLTALLTGWVLARPWQTTIDVGGLFDSPYLRGFYAAEYSSTHDTSFRWSQPAAVVVIPGAGRAAALDLRLYGGTAGGPLTLDAGGAPFTVDLRPGWQHVRLLPRPGPWSGDVVVQLDAPPQTSAADVRARGVVLAQVGVSGRGAPPGQVVLLGLSAALATLLAGWAVRRQWFGLLVGLALALGSAAVLAFDQGSLRLLLTSYSGRLLGVLVLGGLLALGAARLLALLNRRGLLRLRVPTQRALAAVALLAFLLRFGAMAYPLNHNSDLPFILGRTWMIREGQFLPLFLPNPQLTPVQWEVDVTIPRSPFYYILTVPVTFLPGQAGD